MLGSTGNENIYEVRLAGIQEAAKAEIEKLKLSQDITLKENNIRLLEQELQQADDDNEQLQKEIDQLQIDIEIEKKRQITLTAAAGSQILQGIIKSNTGLISKLSGVPKQKLDSAFQGEQLQEADKTHIKDEYTPFVEQLHALFKTMSQEQFLQFWSISVAVDSDIQKGDGNLLKEIMQNNEIPLQTQ